MYLSRVTLNARSRDTRRWLSDRHQMHRVVMSGFPDLSDGTPRAQMGILFRVEPMLEPPYIAVLVQSRIEPVWHIESDAIVAIDPPMPLGPLLTSAEAGSRYRFRLRANPTRRVHKRALLAADPNRSRAAPEKTGAAGKRVELRREEDQLAWLAGRGDHSGFVLVTARLLPADREVPAVAAAPVEKLSGKNFHGGQLSFGTILFEGVLEVTEADRFREAIALGIGPAKAYGCGLLSIAPLAR